MRKRILHDGDSLICLRSMKVGDVVVPTLPSVFPVTVPVAEVESSEVIAFLLSELLQEEINKIETEVK